MAEQMTVKPAATGTTDAAVLGYRRSPAHHLPELMAAAGGEQVRLREVPFLTQITIRATSPEAVEAVGNALGVTMPSAVGEKAHGEFGEGGSGSSVSVVWLSPDEWLAVLGDEADTGVSIAAVVESLNVALGERRGQVVDVSSNRTTLELSGPKARAVLDKTIELDLHPREFPVGRAVSTQMESVAVILWRSAADTWLLMPRASFAEHVVGWLADGMREFS
ncbi:MAG: sarcosine oxidase subunit gamma family protein [Terracoccus sp.]